jgi:hypothetical protein
LPRKRDIEAAIAAHNRTAPLTRRLPPEAARLLIVMFPRGDVCQRTVASLTAEGFDRARSNGTLLWYAQAGGATRGDCNLE